MSTTPDGRKVGRRPATKDFLRSKKAVRIEHEIVDDNEWSSALERAKLTRELAEAKWKGIAGSIEAKTGAARERQAELAEEARAEYDEACTAYDELRDEADDHVQVLVFRAIGAHELDFLNRRHRPTEDDITEAKAQGMTEDEIKAMEHSPTTFPPAFIAASLSDPAMTEDEVRELIWESPAFNEAERMSVLMAATRANGSVARVDLGPTSGGRRDSSKSSASPAKQDAPAASS